MNFPLFSKSRSKGLNRILQSVINRLPIGHQSVANGFLSDVASDRKRAVVSFLEKHSQAKATDFVKVMGLSDSRVRALLRTMIGDGTIEKIGNNRYAYYVLKKK